MRPISLNVSGLQSFREEQTVPFGDLCSGGVFGIFGPTGSGKSTILDAVTLALYGKVERAAGGTHGIMNQAEEKISVSLTFLLGQGKQEKQYTVERTYKRTGEHTIRTSTARLIEKVEGESVVHADKERDVTRLVIELIGLTIEDFTRAVVLPQGKFAEFLSLKGAERRQMLQRLFQLEKYGDALTVKLKKRAETQKNRLNEIAAEQAGLGNASKEALTEAADRLKEEERAFELVTARLKKEEEAYKKTKAYWEVQCEHEVNLKKQKELHTYLPEMQLLREKVKHAMMAERLKPYAQEWQDTIQVENKLRSEKQKLKEIAEKQRKYFIEAEKLHEDAKITKEREEPLLIEKRSKLKDAFEWEKQLKLKEDELKKYSEQLEKLESDFALSKKAENDALLFLQKGKEKQTALKTELASIEVSSQERAHFESALLFSQRFQSMLAEEKKYKSELNRTLTDKREISQRIKQLEEAVNLTIEKWKSLLDGVVSLYDEVCETIRKNDKLIHSTNTAKKKKENLQVRFLASQLSSQLKVNEPCMVCGSTVHPSPIQAGEDHIEEDDAIDFLEAAKDTLHSFRHNLDSVLETLEKLSKKIWNKLGGVDEQAAAKGQMIEERNKTAHPFVPEELNDHTAKVKGILQDRIQFEGNYDTLESHFDDQQKQLEQLMFEQNALDEKVAEFQKLLSENKDSMESILSEWRNAEIPFEMEKLEESLHDFKEREQRQHAIQKSLETAVTFLENQSQIVEKLKDQNKTLEININTMTNKISNQRDQMKEYEELLRHHLGDKKAAEEYDHAEKQLQKILMDYKRTEEIFNKARNLYQEADKSYHSLIQRFEDAQNRRSKAESQWNERLIDSNFDTYEGYFKCVTEESTIQKWEQELTQYFDQTKAIEAAIKTIEEKLPPVKVTEEKLLEQRNLVEGLAHETGVKREAVGQAKQQWLTIEQNHIRYQELDAEKEKVSELMEQLSKLQTVLRGNAFVEFMAEEQLIHVTRDASNRLSKLTRGRYAIEVDSNGGFVIRDDANGGIKRPVTSLSGGETFLTSLALALSLSAQIQLRGKYPLQFFFLDEGFGTLDQELLDTVVTALEKVQMENFAIGVISHVPELKARLSKRLIVEPPEHSGIGTRVKLDHL
jgi:DNA repair protein SbcC/Rad50